MAEWYQETPHPTPVVSFTQQPLLDHHSTLKKHSIMTHMTDPAPPPLSTPKDIHKQDHLAIETLARYTVVTPKMAKNHKTGHFHS